MDWLSWRTCEGQRLSQEEIDAFVEQFGEEPPEESRAPRLWPENRVLLRLFDEISDQVAVAPGGGIIGLNKGLVANYFNTVYGLREADLAYVVQMMALIFNFIRKTQEDGGDGDNGDGDNGDNDEEADVESN